MSYIIYVVSYIIDPLDQPSGDNNEVGGEGGLNDGAPPARPPPPQASRPSIRTGPKNEQCPSCGNSSDGRPCKSPSCSNYSNDHLAVRCLFAEHVPVDRLALVRRVLAAKSKCARSSVGWNNLCNASDRTTCQVQPLPHPVPWKNQKSCGSHVCC